MRSGAMRRETVGANPVAVDLQAWCAHFRHQAHLVALDMRNISAWVEEAGIVVHIVWHRNTRPPNSRVILSVPAIEDYAVSAEEARAVADARFRRWLLATLGEIRSSDGEESPEGIQDQYVISSLELNG